jgi:putative transposase
MLDRSQTLISNTCHESPPLRVVITAIGGERGVVEFCDRTDADGRIQERFGGQAVGMRIGGPSCMARGLRLDIPDGIYHAMARGNRKGIIFENIDDRVRFREILAEAAERYGVQVLEECQMGTHYHLVVRTPRANLSAFMQFLNGRFAQDSNWRHARTGHLFGGRFKPILIDSDLYLRAATSYVVMNPVSGGLVDTPSGWSWSSYRATAGMEEAPSYLWLDWLDTAFPAATRQESQAKYCKHVLSPGTFNIEEWLQLPAIGSESFAEKVRAHVGLTMYLASVPRSYRALHRPPLEVLIPGDVSKQDRDSAILRAYVVHAYTIAEIARYLGLHPSSVSRIVSALRRRMKRI